MYIIPGCAVCDLEALIHAEVVMEQATFLQQLQTEQDAWEAFLATVPVAWQTTAGACGKWSVRDVVGHVAAWERYVTAMVRAESRKTPATPHEIWGEFVPPSTLADDALNEWMAGQLAQRSFPELLAMQRDVRNQLLATVAGLNDYLLTAPEVTVQGLPWKGEKALWEVIASMSYTHVREHWDGLARWLQAQSAILCSE